MKLFCLLDRKFSVCMCDLGIITSYSAGSWSDLPKWSLFNLENFNLSLNRWLISWLRHVEQSSSWASVQNPDHKLLLCGIHRCLKKFFWSRHLINRLYCNVASQAGNGKFSFLKEFKEFLYWYHWIYFKNFTYHICVHIFQYYFVSSCAIATETSSFYLKLWFSNQWFQTLVCSSV